MGKAASSLAILCALLLAATAAPAGANWLTRIGRGAAEIGEGGAKVGKLGLGALDNAAAYVAKLPAPAKGAALAAHATPEGHWRFVNREGEVYTAGNAAEFGRATEVLAPGLSAGDRLAFYLSEDTVFLERARLKDLPADAELFVVAGDDSFRLARRAGGDGERLVAEVRPNVAVEIGARPLFEEAVFHLGRPLNRSNIRVLALEPGGPRALASAPSFDPATKAALIDRIDPSVLPAALGRVKGQTVLVTGRVDGGVLAYTPASGPEQKLFLKDILTAAEAADVNVVVLEAAGSRQPGGRNWLWQTVEVPGLADAMGRATFADFLAALGAGGGELTVTAAAGSPGRIVLRAVPSGEASVPLSGTLAEWMGEITGNVVVKAVEVSSRDADRERELDARFIPGIPSSVQFAYLAGLVMGVLGLGVARRWWARLWPPEDAGEYQMTAGYVAARAARLAAFVFVFLPLIGAPAFIVAIALQLWSFVTAPFRFIGWLRARLSPRAT